MAWTKGNKDITAKTGVVGMMKAATTGPTKSGKNMPKFYELEAAEVVDVILDDQHPDFKAYNDIGKVIARPCQSMKNTPRSMLTKYSPLQGIGITAYPVVGEYVVVMDYLGKFYYSSILNIHNNINHGMWPGKSMGFFPSKNQNAKGNSGDYKTVVQTGVSLVNAGMSLLGKGNSFTPNMAMPPIKVGLGEIVMNGRYGQSIRFGTAGGGKEGHTKPNMIFKVGNRLDDKTYKPQMQSGVPLVEDINKDGTSMFLTTDEKVPLKTATYDNGIQYQRLDKKKRPKTFDGKQIVLNSDRIIFNTKKKEFLCFSQSNQYFCTSEKFIVDSKLGVVLNTEKNIVINNYTKKKNTKTIINSPAIYLGVKNQKKEEKPKLVKGELEHLVLGETLKELLEDLIDAIQKAQYVNGAGPASLNPVNIPKFMGIKNKLKKILSKQNFTL